MSWVLLFALTAVTFFNRYVFLEPKTMIRLPKFTLHMLKYAAPCLMISIVSPVIFFEGGEWKGGWGNSYFYGALLTILVTCITRKLLLSISLSLMLFYIYIYFISF
ncbi:branched-chain amino acid transporter [Acinetobacter sp. ANC 5054]|uniref:AzlD domain-containing protein n=1 Tax=Acinetobacter sp. ANC 5054 TaxID=1977877 RepID=UPI000A3420EA|nr:AzlD domain-containing protein [Acinetobacter sp. ANC 5054]OTG83425.1 branched-chain amino acid transporter [Acinetobacter sp. ANC 5054]